MKPTDMENRNNNFPVQAFVFGGPLQLSGLVQHMLKDTKWTMQGPDYYLQRQLDNSRSNYFGLQITTGVKN